jgi:hypothetical protein
MARKARQGSPLRDVDEHHGLWGRWQNPVDFLVRSLFIYPLLRWSRDARALRVTLGIVGLAPAR